MRQNIPDDKFVAIKRRNAEVFRQTMRITRSGRLPSGTDISEANRIMTDGSVMYDKALDVNNISGCGTETVISTINNDCLLVAADLVRQGYNPVLLNMASGGHPGGGEMAHGRRRKQSATDNTCGFNFYVLGKLCRQIRIAAQKRSELPNAKEFRGGLFATSNRFQGWSRNRLHDSR